MKLKVTMQVNQMPFSPFFCVLGLLNFLFGFFVLVLMGFVCWSFFFACVTQSSNLTAGEYGRVVIMCSTSLMFSTA